MCIPLPERSATGELPPQGGADPEIRAAVAWLKTGGTQVAAAQ